MELSELTTDESIAAQPFQVFLPGCFVVLQGISGDGLPNTIESTPEYVEDDDEGDGEEVGGQEIEDHDELMQEASAGGVEESKTADAPLPLEEDHFRPNSNPNPLLSQLVSSHPNPTCALNNPVGINSIHPPLQTVQEVQSESSPPSASHNTMINVLHNSSNHDDTFVVIPTDSEPRIRIPNDTTITNTTTSASTTNLNNHNSPRKRAIQQWELDLKQRQRNQRQEWHVQQQQHNRQQHPQPSHDTDWWIDVPTGHLAIFDALPTTDEEESQRTIIGTLAPGSTVIAHKMYTLDSETLHTIQVDEETSNQEGDDNTKSQILAPSLGVIQVLELQLFNTPYANNSSSNNNNNNDPNLISEKPTTGYCVYSVHGYAFLVPGIPTLYMDPQVWWWRVTCKVGAYLRQGLELSSDHRCTIPYGSFVQVTRKTVNRMGLSRLRVTAKLDDGQQLVEGWCSEFLNPLSGQRGHVVQPLPFCVPALYRVTLPEGAVIREQVELSSRQIGHAPQGTCLTIVQRQFSEHTQDQCVERLKLAGGPQSGWISVRLNQLPPHDKCVVELVGVDPRFQPNHPGEFHWQILEEEAIRQQELTGHGGVGGNGSNQGGDLSSIDEGSSSADEKPKSRHNNNVGSGGGGRRKQQVETCLICLTEERNATIVHGETGHIACCLVCARILKARGDRCPVCRLEIDSVIQHFWA